MLHKHLNSLILGIFIFISTNVNASHLVGGHMAYEYIGQFGSNYRYKISLITYTDCGPSSQIPFPEDPIQPVGIYTHDVQNNPLGGGNKTLFTELQLNFINSQSFQIEPVQASNCSVGANTCIYKGVYEGTVDLPLNFTGYHVVYERCCRNGSIVNLIPDESMAFYTYIAPPLVANSSPVFTDDPVPFLCAGDTTTILNTAYDPDGDQLVFSFVTPFNGVATATNPAPTPQNPFLQWSIANVIYAGGYSLAQPFGAGGYCSINASTGLTTYYPPAVGDYVVAIEIKEYRNGNLIGITRRDLQLLVLNCPGNPAPNIDPGLGSTNTQYSLEEGETLCFDFGYNDPNGDSITLVANGQIFDNSIVNPSATINSPVSDLDTVSTQFCWTTACGQAQTLPYQFQVSVTDNGCPPKTTNNVFQITVNPVAPPTSINGDSIICQNSTVTYTTQTIPNTTYNWSVTGGNIVTNNGSTVDVQWTTAGTGTISLTAENQFGCNSAPITEDITVTIAPNVDAGSDTTICFGDTVFLSGTTNAQPGYTSVWTGNSIQNATTLNPNVFPNDTTTYYLTIDIGGGCIGIDSVKVNVLVPFVDAGSDTSICFGDSVQLNAQATGGNYLWSPSASLSNDTILNPYASPATTTNYTITLTDTLGCTYQDTVIVNVDPGFTLSVSNDTTICQNDCANLFASGATNYAWSPSSTLNDTTLSNPIACPSNTTTYTVIGSTGTCNDTAQIIVSVNPAVTVDAGLDVAICENDTIQLNATGATNYSWTPNINISNTSISNPLVSPTTTTMYYVIGSDGLNCTATDSVLVTVNPLPTADAGPDTWICPGDNDQLNATGGGTYNWSPSTGLNNGTINNPIASPTDTTTYILTVTSVDGCIDYDTLTVFVSPVVPTDAGSDTTICPGDSIQIGGSPTAVNGTSYLWSPAGLVDNPNSPNPIAFPSVTTMFYVATSNDTCSGLDSVLVTVLPLPNVSAGIDQQICIGDTAQLTATGSTNYAWYQSVFLSDTSVSNPNAFPNDTTAFIVIGTDANGCINQDTVTIIVNPLPNAFAGNDTSICFGDSAQLNATGGSSYSWIPSTGISNSSISSPNASPAITSNYIVSVTDSNSCVNTDTVQVTVNSLPTISAGNDVAICINDTIQLNASGGTTYAWDPNTFISDTTISNPNVFPISTISYIVYSSDINACKGSDTILVTVNNLPAVNAGNDMQICIGDSANLNAVGASSYSWLPSSSLTNALINTPIAFPSDTTSYIVAGVDLNGCSNSDTVIVVVNPLPIANAGTDQNICVGGSANLLATGGNNYVWSPSNSLDNNTISNPVATPDSTTSYSVLVTDSNSCVQSDTVVVNVFRVNTSPDTSICVGDSVQLMVFGSNGLTYSWSPTTGLSDSTIANPLAGPVSNTTYVVTVTNIAGCIDQDSTTIVVNSAPMSSFETEIDAGCDGAIVLFTNTSVNYSTTLWVFGDGSTDTEPNVEHEFPYGNNFNAMLITTNSSGCKDTANFNGNTLNFEDYFSIEIPNVFTPNGDGVNDHFKIKLAGKLYECIDMQIFNRWGQIMFITTGNNTTWDGRTMEGVEVPDGTYFYTITVHDKAYNGTLNIIR